MPESWERHERSQEVPDACPLRLGNNELCGKPSHLSDKIAPYCHYMHRDEDVRQKNRTIEEQAIAACAAEGEFVNNKGRICRITHVSMSELRDNKKKKGHRYKSGMFESTWLTACRERLAFPKAVKAPNVTCLGCLAA